MKPQHIGAVGTVLALAALTCKGDPTASLRAGAASFSVTPGKFYIDTGTIRDAQEHARKMKKVLEEKCYDFSYGEYPESHNWVNWRSRLDDILVYFWGKK